MAKTEDEKTRAWVAQYTYEPYEVVAERLQKRLGALHVRQLWAEQVSTLAETIRSGDSIDVYLSTMNVGLIQLFGEKAQLADRGQEIKLGDKDKALLKASDEVAAAMVFDKKEVVQEKLEAIPEPLGSKCDAGEFDVYNQESLLVIAGVAGQLRKMMEVPWSPYQEHTIRKIAPAVRQVNRAIEGSDRRGIIIGMRMVSEDAGKIIDSAKKSKGLLGFLRHK